MSPQEATVFDASQTPQQWRSDGALFNTFSGFGSPVGNGAARGQGRLTPLLDPIQLTDLFVSSWLMAKICEAGPKEMTRKWGKSISTEIASDVLGEYDKYISKRLKTPKAFREAQTWANLYGGAVIFIGVNDGSPAEIPVDKTKIESIDFLRVMDRYEISPYFHSLAAIDYSNPEYYQTTGEQSLLLGANGEPMHTPGMVIHKSRILRFDGVDIPYRLRAINHGWGLSKLQRVYADFWNFVNTLDNGAAIVAKFDIFNHAIKGLSKMVETGKTGALKAHMREVYEFLGQYGVLLTDGDVESAGFVNRNVGGLKDFLSPLQEVVTAASGMPFSILWGRIGRAGMGGTGQHDIEKEVWAETCHGDQESQFMDLIELEQDYIGFAKDGPMKGKGSEDIGFQFNPILDPDPGEELERKYKQAQIDQIYKNMSDPDGTQVLAAAEIRESRFGGEEYNFETQIDPTLEFEDPLERQAQQLEMQQKFAPKPTVPASKPAAKKKTIAKKKDAEAPIQVKGVPLEPGELDILADVYEADLEDANKKWKDLPEQVVSKKFKKLLEAKNQ